MVVRLFLFVLGQVVLHAHTGALVSVHSLAVTEGAPV